MSIKGLLLSGASLATITAGAAYAEHAPTIHLAALHDGFANGHVKIKTSIHTPKVNHITSSGLIYSSVSASADYKVKTPLIYTYYTFYYSGTFCNANSQNVKVKLASKTTAYAKLGTAVESYSEGCSSETKFYGDTYKLTAKKASGKEDSFVSTLIGKKIHYNGELNDITINFTVDVFIGS